MKKNAMSQIAVGLLSTCLAGAALANGGPGDLCNSDNIHRSNITSINKNSPYKALGYKYERTIHNTTGVLCAIKFRGNNWSEQRLMNINNLATKPSEYSILKIDSGYSTTVYGVTQNDITYERGRTVAAIIGVTEYAKGYW